MLRFPVVILAGGLAQRLKPLTDRVPKALIPINGEPVLAHQLRLLRRQGCERVILCVGHLEEQIRAFAGDGGAFGLHVTYSSDGEQLMGTAGALRRALPCIDAEACFVLYGDSYLTCDFARVEDSFLRQGKPALMCVFKNDGVWDNSNVQFSDGRIRQYSKTNRTPEMQHIDYGLGVLSREVMDGIPAHRAVDLASVYEQLVADRRMAAFEVHERFYEVGSFQGIEDLSGFLRRAALT